MPYDGFVLSAVVQNLNKQLLGGRIERVYQPEKEKLILAVYNRGKRFRLLLSAHSSNARVHLTNASHQNPLNPPVFCMVLRKHIEGGHIKSFEQPGLERVLKINISTRDEWGHQSERTLICEIMGKHSNIILVDPDDDAILDGIKRYTHAVSRHREVLPGYTYFAPPGQNKINPLTIEEEAFRAACLAEPLENKLAEVLFAVLEGFSPLTCKELVYRTGLGVEFPLEMCGDYELRLLWESLQGIVAPARDGIFQPALVVGMNSKDIAGGSGSAGGMGSTGSVGSTGYSGGTGSAGGSGDAGGMGGAGGAGGSEGTGYSGSAGGTGGSDITNREPVEFAALELTLFHDREDSYLLQPNEMNAVLDEYFRYKESINQTRQIKQNYIRSINAVIKKLQRKLREQTQDFSKAEKADKYREWGELLFAHLHDLKKEKGRSEVVLESLYNPGEQVAIEMDPSLEPRHNAEKFFKRYRKAKTALVILKERIQQTKGELDYLQSVEVALQDSTTLGELEEIRQELADGGYIKKRKEKTKKRLGIPAPASYTSTDGFIVLLGKNNRQNDYLTLKIAGPEDIWLHTKDIPGAHVVIKTGARHNQIPQTTLVEAAQLAALNSKARQSQNVPVDYTQKKYVTKPKGSKPGMVIYRNHKTLTVNPKDMES